MTVLTDICVEGPYVLDITTLSPNVYAFEDLLHLHYEINHRTLKFPKFRYLLAVSCRADSCPMPSDYTGNNKDLMVSVEFWQKNRGRWITYALSTFNVTKREIECFSPIDDNVDCVNEPPFESLLLWRDYILGLALLRPNDIALSKFAVNFRATECGSKCPPDDGGWFIYKQQAATHVKILPSQSCAATPSTFERDLASTRAGLVIGLNALQQSELFKFGMTQMGVENLHLVYCPCPPGKICVPAVGCIPEEEEEQPVVVIIVPAIVQPTAVTVDLGQTPTITPGTQWYFPELRSATPAGEPRMVYMPPNVQALYPGFGPYVILTPVYQPDTNPITNQEQPTWVHEMVPVSISQAQRISQGANVRVRMNQMNTQGVELQPDEEPPVENFCYVYTINDGQQSPLLEVDCRNFQEIVAQVGQGLTLRNPEFYTVTLMSLQDLILRNNEGAITLGSRNIGGVFFPNGFSDFDLSPAQRLLLDVENEIRSISVDIGNLLSQLNPAMGIGTVVQGGRQSRVDIPVRATTFNNDDDDDDTRRNKQLEDEALSLSSQSTLIEQRLQEARAIRARGNQSASQGVRGFIQAYKEDNPDYESRSYEQIVSNNEESNPITVLTTVLSVLIGIATFLSGEGAGNYGY